LRIGSLEAPMINGPHTLDTDAIGMIKGDFSPL
jgi:hypothetical protein